MTPPGLLLIRGLGHSGSTILDLALGAHPQVVGLGEAVRILTRPAPGEEGRGPAQLRGELRLPQADLNVCLYPEVAGPVCSWLERSFGMAVVRTVPIGVGATGEFLAELGEKLGLELDLAGEADKRSRLPWYSRSVDSTYLTGKRVFIFADATHAIAAARIASQELGFTVVGLGTYSREQAREVRAAAQAPRSMGPAPA
jgi:light-independent protochlorophyllide reductase subunit B